MASGKRKKKRKPPRVRQRQGKADGMQLSADMTVKDFVEACAADGLTEHRVGDLLDGLASPGQRDRDRELGIRKGKLEQVTELSRALESLAGSMERIERMYQRNVAPGAGAGRGGELPMGEPDGAAHAGGTDL